MKYFGTDQKDVYHWLWTTWMQGL